MATSCEVRVQRDTKSEGRSAYVSIFLNSIVGTSEFVSRRSISRAAKRCYRTAGTTTRCTVDASTVSDTLPARDDPWKGLREILPFTVLRKLNKTGQYLGNEKGAVRKPWDSVKVRFCLAFPDLYSIGMSSTGHVVLYSCINENSSLLCDRSYLPAPDMEDALKTYRKPLFAIESKRPLADFHVIGMSLMYELTATNCLKMLQLANIPYTWKERDTPVFTDGPPLIFAGGLTVTANPEPYADFFDFFSIGDGEDMLPQIGDVVARVLDENPRASREELLLHLVQEVKGVYAPRFYERGLDGAVRPTRADVPMRIQRQTAAPEPWRAMSLVPLVDAVHDRLSVEIRRGCTRGCRCKYQFDGRG